MTYPRQFWRFWLVLRAVRAEVVTQIKTGSEKIVTFVPCYFRTGFTLHIAMNLFVHTLQNWQPAWRIFQLISPEN